MVSHLVVKIVRVCEREKEEERIWMTVIWASSFSLFRYRLFGRLYGKSGRDLAPTLSATCQVYAMCGGRTNTIFWIMLPHIFSLSPLILVLEYGSCKLWINVCMFCGVCAGIDSFIRLNATHVILSILQCLATLSLHKIWSHIIYGRMDTGQYYGDGGLSLFHSHWRAKLTCARVSSRSIFPSIYPLLQPEFYYRSLKSTFCHIIQ